MVKVIGQYKTLTIGNSEVAMG